jgi:hypothetical protein
MEKHPKFYLFLILVFALTGCKLVPLSKQPTQVEQIQTPPIISLTSTLTPTPIPSITLAPIVTIEQHASPTLTPTITMTPLNTLEPEKANEMIKTLLREPVDCSAPCFWGIVPGQTTIEEAESIFSHLGLQTEIITYQGKDFYNVAYDLDSGLSIYVNLPIQNEIVENIELKINAEKQNAGISRDWLAYSPETLIERYGIPSRVDIGIDWGPNTLFTMELYFDEVDLIVEYGSTNMPHKQNWTLEVCPLTAQLDGPWLWMGKNPRYPPGRGASLESVTSLTLDEFSKLMTGDPDDACFIVDGDVFK